MGNKAILEKIKELLTGKEVSLSAELSFLTVEVGDVTIQVEGEVFEVGQAVSIATEEGFIPAGTSLDGDHTIEGVTITIADGIITEVKEETVAEEVEEEIVEENKIEVFKFQELEDKISKLEEMITSITEKLTASEEKLEAFSNKVEKVWDAAPAEPKLENFKTESNIKKTFNNPLEGIRSIRSKK